ncbi:endoplasmic reticulum resident protein 27 [Pelodytes ibericus]
MVLPPLSSLLLLFLVRFATSTEVANTTISTEFVKQPRDLNDVSSAKSFINSTEFAVIAFIQDPEEPEIEQFKTLVKDFPDWEYGVSRSLEVLKHFKIKGNSVSYFRQVDRSEDHLMLKDVPNIDAVKLYRFLTINELRYVTEYNAVTAIGIRTCDIQVHLLLFVEKTLDREDEIMNNLRDAAKELQGKVLFIKVNVALKGNEKPMAFLGLKRSDLPKVVIYNMDTEKKRVMEESDFTTEKLKTFCLSFLSEENTEEETETKNVKSEL